MAEQERQLDGNPNLLDRDVRNLVIKDIKSEENRARKREQQKRFDVYRERQDRYILERLEREFSAKTVNEMRKIFSINLSKRIIDEMSSIYNIAPERDFAKLSGSELSDAEMAQLEAIYEECRVNVAMRQANRYYNLQDQTAIMAVPDKCGGLKVKAIPQMHYDVIPDAINPEKAYAYILNVWNFDLHKTTRNSENEPTQLNRYRQNDRMNQVIADENDRKAMQERYIVWTPTEHFVMNGKGEIQGDVMANPIGRLPFVDVAAEKDFQFFVRRGTGVVDFALDFGLLLSDLSNIIRLQGYSQAIVHSEKQPTNMVVGPNHVLWMQLDPNRPELSPKFEFASPSPDLAGSLEFLETTLRLFLSSRGIDPGTISGKGESKSFSSGLERLLAMLDKFEATRADFDLFKDAEQELFDILVRWSNVFQKVKDDQALVPSLMQATVPDDVFMDVKFNEPMMVQTQSEKEASVQFRVDQGVMSEIQALMKLDDLSEEGAIQKIKEKMEHDKLLEEMQSEMGIEIAPAPLPQIDLQPEDVEQDELEVEVGENN